MKTVRIVMLALAAVSVVVGMVDAELKVGPPPTDPRYRATLVIHNSTGVAIPYQLKWGDGPWKPFTLRSGYSNSHSNSLDTHGQALIPYVKFDRIAGDSGVTLKTYELDFAKVATGNSRSPGGPISYEFKYAADGRHLDLLKKR